ncbi:MAG: hypothetical protein Q8O57_01930, partial [Kiritimatiellota bacterium]|nr:hypothetical protein [Kiritimatiellota bacterium]
MNMTPASSEPFAYPGQRYEATVPDTLDLAERAALALHGIAGVMDANMGYTMFFHTYYAFRTPYLSHHNADITVAAKHGEVIPLLRIASGSRKHMDVELGQRADMLARIHDGLYWRFYDASRPWNDTYSGMDRAVQEDTASICGTGLMIRAMLRWREWDGRTIWDKPIRDLVRGLRRIAVQRGDYAYYPYGVCE